MSGACKNTINSTTKLDAQVTSHALNIVNMQGCEHVCHVGWQTSLPITTSRNKKETKAVGADY